MWGTEIKGLNIVLTRLNREIEQIEGRSVQGLIKGAGYVRRKTEKSFPKVPRDLGNLKASWFVVTASGAVQGGEEAMMDRSFVGPNAQSISSSYQGAVWEAQAEARKLGGLGKKFIIFGYGANYAFWVHEMVGANFENDTGPKWLQTHLSNSIGMIVKIVAENARVK